MHFAYPDGMDEPHSRAAIQPAVNPVTFTAARMHQCRHDFFDTLGIRLTFRFIRLSEDLR
ncbi:conserved hypothetical protein [Ricinus communis]|uniref:Uncharacterized protein n=1 Tax=Ricinus communis TaxID=3988 RepID=B9TD66_RICCO|nr:conserved hypothetical protein [Ricinus communis]